MYFFKKYRVQFSTVFLVVLFIMNACKDQGTNPEDQAVVLPDSNLTYIDHIRELFILKCASRNGCHSSIDQAAGLNLTDYQALTNHFIDNGSVPLIIFRDGENSALYRILLGPYLSNPRMPLDGPYLNENQTNGVRRWIDEGAPFSAK